MTAKVYRVPETRQIVDEGGNLSEEYHAFLKSVGFTQGAAIPSVANADTNANLSTAVNAILALLRSQNRIKT